MKKRWPLFMIICAAGIAWFLHFGDEPRREGCPLSDLDGTGQIYLLSANTGERYSLDLPGDSVDAQKNAGYISTQFGRDAMSGASVAIMKMPGQKRATVTLKRGAGSADPKRMKSLFCEDCLKKMECALEKHAVKEYMLYEADRGMFWPIEEGTLQIGKYTLQMIFEKDGYRIEIMC